MKHSIFTLALFYFFNLASAQDVLHIESIPTQVSAFQTGVGIPLNTGWKWKDGDSLAWSRPDFDDHLWQPINPLLDVHDSLPQLPKSSVFWLRTLFILNTAIQKRQLALLIQQTGASEVYLNGELIKSFGIINTDPGKTFAYNPAFLPVLLPVNNKDTQVLAIRYLLDKNAHYTKAFATTNPLFEAKLQYASEATSNYYLNIQLLNNYYFFATGLFFLLALIHVSYYFFQKAQRANLFFALYALCYIAFIQSSVVIDTHIVSDKYYALTTGLLLIIIIGPLLLTAIYELLHAKKDWIYKTLLLFSGISAIMYFWQYEWGWHAGADIMSLLIQIAIVRIVFKAVYQKKKGARILAVGSIIFLISFGLFILISLFSPQNLLLMNLFFVFGVLSIPLATSIYLGLEFGFLNFALQGKLVEVSELSIKNINQEKEKQQILANQNETLEKQVAERTAELQQSLQNLKSTQAQLIQSEKMASLGELTAGIAHEIQNPLNFVNNFSDVNTELIGELKEELAAGNMQLATEIADDIQQNEAKINHHGKRADAIVKGMLQHSRTSTGEKEATDINKLADEYLRLAYQGMRAKDNAFNTEIKTEFDASIGNIDIVPQDIGRMLLNLYNNAFYAVNEKAKLQGAGYKPEVCVTMKKINGRIEISVRDNGNGIPQNIVDKVFQPFFTTKPTGSGTGLGLSLSYDIVKAHGGEIKVISKVDEGNPGQSGKGEGSEFIVVLPT